MKSVDEYLAEVLRVIRANFRPGDASGGMTAARLGYLIEQVIPGAPQALGFGKLKDALLVLESRGLLRTGPNSKGALSVWPTSGETQVAGAGAASGVSVGIPHGIPQRGADLGGPGRHQGTGFFRPLKNNVWLALVSETPSGRRFLNRVTGEVALGREASPEPASGWLEIKPLDGASEQEDARSFLRQEGRQDEPHLRAALDSAEWWRLFPQALRTADPLLASKWNRRRSNRVVAAAEAWCKESGIRPELIFASPEAAAAPRRTPEAGRPETTLATLMGAAVRRMTVEELLELSIPAKYLVAELRPELLR